MLIQTAPHTGDYASVAAQLIPLFLLSSIVVTKAVSSSLPSRRTGLELVVVGCTVALAFLAEIVALFGVRHGGLTARDANALDWLLFLLAVATVGRVVLPLLEEHRAASDTPNKPVVRIFAAIVVVVFVALFVMLGVLERL